MHSFIGFALVCVIKLGFRLVSCIIASDFGFLRIKDEQSRQQNHFSSFSIEARIFEQTSSPLKLAFSATSQPPCREVHSSTTTCYNTTSLGLYIGRLSGWEIAAVVVEVVVEAT